MNRFLIYGIPNIISILFCFIFLLISFLRYRKSSYKDKLKPLKLIFFIVVILEIIKIFYHIASQKAYPPQRYPLLFCSLPMFLYPIIFSTKEDNILSRMSKGISIFPFLVIGLLYAVLIPKGNEEIQVYPYIMNFHSRFYHFLIGAGALYMVIIKLYDFRFKDFFVVALGCCVYFLVISILSLFIGGSFLYIGVNTAYLEYFHNTFGYFTTYLLACIALFIAGFVLYSLVYLIKKIFVKKTT